MKCDSKLAYISLFCNSVRNFNARISERKLESHDTVGKIDGTFGCHIQVVFFKLPIIFVDIVDTEVHLWISHDVVAHEFYNFGILGCEKVEVAVPGAELVAEGDP